jgi:hypothetical protein
MAVDVKAQATTFEAGIPRTLFNVTGIRSGNPGPGVVNGSYVPSSDGQKFVVAVIPNREDSNPFTVVLNWTAGLKK